MTFLNKNWFWLMIIVVMGLVLLKSCNTNPKLKEQISKLEKAKDSIEKSIELKNLKIDTLNKAIASSRVTIDSLSKEKQKVKIQRVEVITQVDNFTDSELDSIINSVPKKLAVKSILDYPLVLKELDVTNSMVLSYKTQVKDLEKRDALRVAIIEDKTNQLHIAEQQRDLYKKEARPKSGAFLYIEIPVNKPQRFEVGIDYQIKNKLLVGVSGDYNDITKDTYINGKLGIRIW